MRKKLSTTYLVGPSCNWRAILQCTDRSSAWSGSPWVANGRIAEFHVDPGTRHWFFESDRTDTDDPEAAELAWQRTVALLHRHLKE